jgi:hypothetical protein
MQVFILPYKGGVKGMVKQNCWEFKKCGRIPGGTHEKDLGICPVHGEKKLDTVHSGKNAGRTCWVVAGTLCNGKVQGTFAQKYEECEKCDFYQLVWKEEGPHYKLANLLIRKLREE